MSRIEDALAKANEKRSTNRADGNDARPVMVEKSTPSKGKSILLYGFSLALVLGAGLYLYYYMAGDQGNKQLKPATPGVAAKSFAAVQQTTQAIVTQHERRLPSCILETPPDPSYSAVHPGWQRFADDVLEYRVYREGSVIKAIQGIGRQGKTISGEFFASFLKVTSGQDSFTLHSSEKRAGSLIEKGLVGRIAEVIVYRNPNGQIIAFVLAYL